MAKNRIYRGYLIFLESDGRYDVYEKSGDALPIAENFQTISLAMEWIDQTQFD